ncbi:hypothetical protein [Microbacterium sp. SORGH_AS_0421]|uniref:hypothetical protein n=1 Tax=Microbacterium sp. SORGH_AS_0421 TaxID=3041768 RepID=UPI0027926681|nr:hypothetical protein [Microbacterium sp. SORGH_AS_0421]MDQ1176689.1 hypothetical protein [Microbacterium sp. SORGH_AS_0421]
MSGSNSEFSTAMEVVRAAERGILSREQLVRILGSWDYEPQHRSIGLADDWELRDNSFDAVVHAFTSSLIDGGDYECIVGRLDGAELGAQSLNGRGASSASSD